MALTPKFATPLHMAAGTANHAVANVLLRTPSVDVNAKNKHNTTPYDVATSNREMLSMVNGPEAFHQMIGQARPQGMRRTPVREEDVLQKPG